MNEAVVLQRIRSGLLIRLDGMATVYQLKQSLTDKLACTDDFFNSYPAVLYCGNRDLREIDLDDIMGIIVSKFELSLRLIISDNESVRNYGARMGCQVSEKLEKSEFEDVDESGSSRTLWVNRHVRNGHRIDYDGNIVVMGDVNRGAEVVATGNILVLGACRGVVHAGSDGNEKSMIMASRMQPTQIRIAYCVTRAPDMAVRKFEKKEAYTGPEAARIHNGGIVIEYYKDLL